MSSVASLRSLRCDKIGHLTTISGTVTRSTEVRPELVRGHFICDVCGFENKDVAQQFRYTEVRAKSRGFEKYDYYRNRVLIA